ncbi:MAG TPA: hypothetical protein VMT46_13770 [Anaerolineaceae bacterium]|nr:hypothetical protein [Anaerolineaceae bacterium]
MVLIILAIGGLAVYFRVRPEPLPLDSPEAGEIQAALVRMYMLEQKFQCHTNMNVRVLDEVVADSSDYHPGEKEQTRIEQVFGPQAREQNGYLSFLQANYLAQRPEYALPQPTGVAPTLPPGRPPLSKCDDSKPWFSLVVNSIGIENAGKAIVHFKFSWGCDWDGESILRKMNGQWMVTSVRQTAFHGCG